MKCYPKLGEICGARIDPDDMVYYLAGALREASHNARKNLNEDERDDIKRLIKDCHTLTDSDVVDATEANSLCERLGEKLDVLAAPYCYFGVLDGNYGFWISHENLNDSDEIYRLGAGDPWPRGISKIHDYILEVTDHGNMTLYRAKDHREIWSIV